MDETLNFEVQEYPVMFNNGRNIVVSTSHKVIYNMQTSSILNVVKNSYSVLKNRQFIDYVNRMVKITNFTLEGFSTLKKGGIVLAHLKNNTGIKYFSNHDINDYMVIGNSHDGSRSFFIGSTTEVIKCQNQFSLIKNTERIKHTISIENRIESLYKDLGYYIQTRDTMYKKFNIFNNIQIEKDTVKAAIDLILNIKEETLDSEKLSTRKLNQKNILEKTINSETERLGDTVWGLFNGVTKYTTHVLKSKDKGFGILNGNAYRINSKIYNYCSNLILK